MCLRIQIIGEQFVEQDLLSEPSPLQRELVRWKGWAENKHTLRKTFSVNTVEWSGGNKENRIHRWFYDNLGLEYTLDDASGYIKIPEWVGRKFWYDVNRVYLTGKLDRLFPEPDFVCIEHKLDTGEAALALFKEYAVSVSIALSGPGLKFYKWSNHCFI